MEGTVVKARAIFCPNCGSTIKLRGFAHTLNAVCESCGTVVDPTTPSVRTLQKAQIAQRIEPKIPMGSRGTFHGIEYEAIGFQQRGITVDGIVYTWEEYLLFHPYHGFRYLSEYNGHWNFIKPVQVIPEVNGREMKLGDTKYKHFQSAVANTYYVVGEFPWQVRVGDVVNVDDFIAPPLILSSERTPEEVNYSIGEYVEGPEVWKAFKLQGAPPPAIGVYANQPNPRANNSLWRLYWMFFLLSFFISSYACIGKSNKQVFRESFQFVPSSTAEASFVTKFFDLPGSRKAATEIEVKSDVSNNWMAVAVALINDQTGEAFDFGKEMSYYSGSDSDGSWSEGSRGFTVTIPEVPPGRYYLRVEPDRERTPGEPNEDITLGKTINYEIIVRHDIPAYWMIWVIWIALLIPPIWVSMRKGMFEQRRWAESDYAPESSGGSDDSSSSDD